ncbi:MAG: SH3 domain-containing protein [Devosia sp.]
MSNSSRIIAIVTVLSAGLIGLTLIPGSTTAEIATADGPALSRLGAPSPVLLRTLDAELAPPKVKPPQPVRVATSAPTRSAPVTPPPPAPVVDSPQLRHGRIGPVAVNLRAGPSSSSAVLSVLSPDEAVQVGDITRGWVQVTRSDGTSGWAYKSYLAGSAPAAPRVASAIRAP